MSMALLQRENETEIDELLAGEGRKEDGDGFFVGSRFSGDHRDGL